MSVDPRKFVQTLCILHIKIAQILCTVVKKTLVVTLWDMCNARSSPRESNVNIQYTCGWWMVDGTCPANLYTKPPYSSYDIFGN